jgi:hypothetical protein
MVVGGENGVAVEGSAKIAASPENNLREPLVLISTSLQWEYASHWGNNP